MRSLTAAAVVLAAAFPAASSPASPRAGGAVTALAARGATVWAGTATAGLFRSTDGGLTFAAVPEVVCPGSAVRDVALGDPGKPGTAVFAACGAVKTAWAFDGSAWTKLDSGSATYGDICPGDDLGPGRPLIHDDPLAPERPLRVTGRFSCGFDSCDAYETLESPGATVSRADVFRCPLALSRLLAPPSAASPFVVFTTRGASGTDVFRGAARNRFDPAYLGPNSYGDRNLERIGSIPDRDLAGLARDRNRPARLLAGGTTGLFVSEDEGTTWRRDTAVEAPVGTLAVDPTAPGRYAVASGRKVVASQDGGTSFATVLEAPVAVGALAFDGDEPSRLLAGLADGSVTVISLLFPLGEPRGRPTLLDLTPLPGRSSVVVRWAARSDAAVRYRAERRLDGEDAWQTAGRLAAGSGPLFVEDSAAPPDRLLRYRVVAEGPDRTEAVSEEGQAVLPTTEPLPPEGLTASPTGGGVLLAWTDRSGREDGFLVEFVALDGTWRPWALLPANTTSLALPASPLTRTFFRVRATNALGTSPPSGAVSGGASRPALAPVLAGQRREGLRVAELRVTAALDTLEAEVSRSVGTGSFLVLGRIPLDVAGFSRTGAFTDDTAPGESTVVYRARGVNPAGTGPDSAPLSLGTYATAPDAPCDVSASFAPGGTYAVSWLTAAWSCGGGREDGFAAAYRGLFRDVERPLGLAPRGTATLSGIFSNPGSTLASYQDPTWAGDVVVLVRGFNGAGTGPPAPPARLRIWPLFESFEPAGGYSYHVPYLLPSVVEGEAPGLPPETTEMTDPEVRMAFEGGYYRILESRENALLGGVFPRPETRRRTLADVFGAVRRDHPLLPASGLHSGAMLRYADPRSHARPLVRVLTPAREGGRDGFAGWAYPAVPLSDLDAGPVVLTGLREGNGSTSEVVLVHPGSDPKPVTLQVRVVDGATGSSSLLPPVTLSRGERRLLPGVLSTAGFPTPAQGWVEVTVPSGSGAFLAHAVVREAASGDGRFVASRPLWAYGPALYVPIALELPGYRSRATLTNVSGREIAVTVQYVQSSPEVVSYPPLPLRLEPGRQIASASLLDDLRTAGLPIPPVDGSVRAGTLRILPVEGTRLEEVHAAVEVVTADGRYGFAAQAVPEGLGNEGPSALVGRPPEARLWALRDDDAVRSYAVVTNLSPETATVAAYVYLCLTDPAYPCAAASAGPPYALGPVQLPAGGWLVFPRPLLRYPGWDAVVAFQRLAGPGPLYAYALVVDDVTGDASFFEATPAGR